MPRRLVKKKQNFIEKIQFLSKGANGKKDFYGKFRSKKCLTIYLVADREYTYKMSGRCTSFRSRGNISNFVIRNFSYGVEQRIFTHNPRLNVYFLVKC